MLLKTFLPKSFFFNNVVRSANSAPINRKDTTKIPREQKKMTESDFLSKMKINIFNLFFSYLCFFQSLSLSLSLSLSQARSLSLSLTLSYKLHVLYQTPSLALSHTQSHLNPLFLIHILYFTLSFIHTLYLSCSLLFKPHSL